MSMDDFEQWEEEYKRAYTGYSKLYNEDSGNYDVIYGLLDCMKKLVGSIMTYFKLMLCLRDWLMVV